MDCAPCDLLFTLRILARFEEQNGNLAHVEVDEVLRLVGHITKMWIEWGSASNILPAKIPAHNAMPCWVVHPVEFLLDVRSNVFLNVKFLHRVLSAINRLLLHLLSHVGILYNSLLWGSVTLHG